MTQFKNLDRIFEPSDLSLDSGGHNIPYQSMLRVIGTILDQLDAADLALIEGSETFIVRFSSRGECEVRELSYADLLEAYQTLRNERTLLGTVEQGYFQDLLRALGYELERVHGSNLLLAEAGEHYLLTFQCPAAGNAVPHRRHALLSPPMVEELLSRAHGRRASTSRWEVDRKRRAEAMMDDSANSHAPGDPQA